ncbi:13523_t:CDS:1, partial [Acaulospora morrowiae]
AVLILVLAGVWYVIQAVKQQLIQEIQTRDARFTAELATRDDKLAEEGQIILTLLNTSTTRHDEIEQ